jgi:hypothetical protein
MSQLLEHAKQHFRELIQGQGLHCIEIPEWGEKDKPAKLYFRPLAALPVHTYSKVVALGLQQTVEAFVDILILRCIDENAQPIFRSVDRTEMLRNISPVVVCNIIKQMSEVDGQASSDKENSEANSLTVDAFKKSS